MDAQTLAIGVSSLIGIILLAVMLAGRHTTGKVQTIDLAQVKRTAQAVNSLKTGVLPAPRLSASDKRLFRL
jgi:hypothetical protein